MRQSPLERIFFANLNGWNPAMTISRLLTAADLDFYQRGRDRFEHVATPS